MTFEQKYLKYKQKYLNLKKNQFGAADFYTITVFDDGNQMYQHLTNVWHIIPSKTNDSDKVKIINTDGNTIINSISQWKIKKINADEYITKLKTEKEEKERIEEAKQKALKEERITSALANNRINIDYSREVYISNLRELLATHLYEAVDGTYWIRQYSHDFIKKIKFDDKFNEPLGNSLDKLINLESLEFGEEFNQPLGNSLNSLINLKSLEFNDTNFNQPLGDSLKNLKNLRSLIMFNSFNQPLGNSLDGLINLQILKFGLRFQQPLGQSLNNLKNLEYLELQGYRHPIGSSLQGLTNLKSTRIRGKPYP